MQYSPSDLEKPYTDDDIVSSNKSAARTRLQEQKEKAVLRRIDSFVMPLLCTLWFLQVLVQ